VALRSGHVRNSLSAGRLCRLVLSALICFAIAGSGRATTLTPNEEAEQALDEARQAILDRALDRAELRLERVLMLVPDHAEARVMLASLMAQLGRLETALLLLQSLIDDPRTAEDYRQRLRSIYLLIIQAPRLASLNRLPQRLGPDPTPQAYWRSEIAYGLSTNPLSRTSANELPLTFADSQVSLPLQERPVSGQYLTASIANFAKDSGFDFSATRVATASDQQRLSDAARFIAWGPIIRPLYWQFQAQQGLDAQRRYTLGLSYVEGRHRVNVSAYNDPARADAGGLIRYEQRVIPAMGGLWSSNIERGFRAARTPDYWRLGVSGEYDLGSQRFLVMNWSVQADLSGYNPLLENNSRRWLETRSVVLEQHIPIGKQKVLVLRGLATERRSNLTIFSFRDVGLQVSFVATWL
jgi:hypothetical protein